MRHAPICALRHTLVSMAALVALAVSGLAGPAAAWAATAPVLASLRWVVGVGSQAGETVVIVTGTLPGSVKLPAKIVIPVPKDVTPAWVGEIVGTDSSKDPTAVYSTASGPKYDTMTITLKAARVGQAEYTIQSSGAGQVTDYSAQVPILGPVGSAAIEIRVPSGSVVTSLSPGVTLTGSSGGLDFYSLTKKAPRRGSTIQAALTGDPGATQQPGAASEPGTPGAAPVGSPLGAVTGMVGVLAAGLTGFVGVLGYHRVRDRRAAESAPEDDAPQPKESATRKPKPPKRPKQAEPVAPSEPEPEADESRPMEPDQAVVTEEPAQDPASQPHAAPVAPAEDPIANATAASPDVPGTDIVAMVKRLAALKKDGLLGEEEFALAKQGLLAGDATVAGLLADLARFKADGLLSDEEFGAAKEQLLTGSTAMILEVEELVGLQEQDLLSRDEFRAIVDRLLNG
jgi:hypothetical protein